MFDETIVALSSGHLPSGVAVIRLSGPHCRFVTETISGPAPKERFAVFRELVGAGGVILDRGLVIFFSGPRSFTGEDVAEFHVHGGRAVVAALLEHITAFEGVRSADAGEFTRRAFLNGKVDLVEAEALADLINAETEAQRRFATLNAGGAQSALYLEWRRRLIEARAMIEAGIDFSDEGDVADSSSDEAWADVNMLRLEIMSHMEGFGAAEILRDGFDVVIIGAPNSGKSSLFNALAGRDAAIVTEEPGTTRDLLEVALDIGGLRVRVTDTAGLRRVTGKVEALGIERAVGKARQGDLVLMLEDMVEPVAVNIDGGTAPTLRVGTKSDLLDVRPGLVGKTNYDLRISSKTGAGLDELLGQVVLTARARIEDAGPVLPSRVRHVELLQDAISHMDKAGDANGLGIELRAEELRLAADRLGRIVGAVDVEDLLDVIFAQFCIGK